MCGFSHTREVPPARCGVEERHLTRVQLVAMLGRQVLPNRLEHCGRTGGDLVEGSKPIEPSGPWALLEDLGKLEGRDQVLLGLTSKMIQHL